MRPLRFFRAIGTSLTAKLAIAAFISIAVIAAAHVMSLDRLFVAERNSSEFRGRWLDSVRTLGQLNERISDLRFTEADVLLARDGAARVDRVAAFDATLKSVSATMERYRSFPHDTDEAAAFGAFEQNWNEHVQNAQKTAVLVRGGDTEAAFVLFDGAARTSFSQADRDLMELIALTADKADAARMDTAAAIANAQRWISDLILGILVLFLLLAGYLWWGVSKPIMAISRLMRRLADHETDFSIPFERKGDEIGQLARVLVVFRRNTIELLESRRRLSSQTAILTETLEKERELAVEQRNFITTVSHEIRTPLMVIDGNAQRLITMKDRVPPPDIVDRATRIRTAVFRMTSLVASLMASVELAGRGIQARVHPFDFRSMLERLARYYTDMGVGGGLELHIEDAPNVFVGDEDLLYQVVSNLISNAFKYSPEHAMVGLRVVIHDDVLKVIVEDQGIGIPRDEISRVSERYFRASNVGSVTGGGLGLHLVHEIVRRHGGRIEIESEEGKGTRVTVSLPSRGFDECTERSGAQNPVRGGRRGNGESDRRGAA